MITTPALLPPVEIAAAAELSSSPYGSAVAARQKGDPARAIALLTPWLARKPGDVDSRLQYGLALLDQGRLEKAAAEFRLVLQAAPAYDDARIALARIAQRRGDMAGARAALAPVPLTNKEAVLLRRQLDEPGTLRWGLAIDASRTQLGRGHPDWREVDVQLSFRANEQTTLVGRVEASRRFNIDDTYAEGQLVTHLSPSLTAYAMAGGTPQAHYRPRWQIAIGGAFTIQSTPDATAVTLDLRLSDYRSGQIATISPGIEQYWSRGHNRLSAQLIAVVERGQVHLGLLSRLDGRATGHLQLFAGAAHAPDVSEGIVLPTTSVFGGGELRVSSVASLRLSASVTSVHGSSDRTQLSFGFGTRF